MKEVSLDIKRQIDNTLNPMYEGIEQYKDDAKSLVREVERIEGSTLLNKVFNASYELVELAHQKFHPVRAEHFWEDDVLGEGEYNLRKRFNDLNNTPNINEYVKELEDIGNILRNWIDSLKSYPDYVPNGDDEYARGGKVDAYKIYYLNKNKNHQRDEKVFEGKDAYEKAVKWGERNLSNFHEDMIRLMARGGRTGVQSVLTDNEIEMIKQSFAKGDDLIDTKEGEGIYEKLYDYYAFRTNEMPYGTMKARTGDPYEWIYERLHTDLNVKYLEGGRTRKISDKYGKRMARKQALKDISKEYNKFGDPFDFDQPSEYWRRYPIKYDTKFKFEEEMAKGGFLNQTLSFKELFTK